MHTLTSIHYCIQFIKLPIVQWLNKVPGISVSHSLCFHGFHGFVTMRFLQSEFVKLPAWPDWAIRCYLGYFSASLFGPNFLSPLLLNCANGSPTLKALFHQGIRGRLPGLADLTFNPGQVSLTKSDYVSFQWAKNVPKFSCIKMDII